MCHVIADERRCPSRIDAVRGQQDHSRARGDALGGRPRPGKDPGARRQCRQHGASRARGQVVVDLKSEGRMPGPARQRRGHCREQFVGLPVLGPVHTGEAPDRGGVRALRERGDDNVDP
ncbi:hypothetical protein MTE01_20640 [Microbacterium testaceum]|uniref:Uncharacterized protein n=1 Tax=Microbacterium testaceum TaxID=2033 RepID=A0A4Y3QME7_MICTE|nr:hypothetical protein MTE01_20640 [Microbacterium testaceum]